MQPYFFSIIIPTRSYTTYLDETLPAINKLNYEKFEAIILADDVHGFDKAKNKYKWLKVIKSSNRPGKKRDEGAKNAKGDFLAFIDDDAYPQKDWLTNANNILQKEKSVVALGGPGVLPQNATLKEKIFDASIVNILGGGGYTYRFRAQEERFVDDYPSMNLIIQRKIFLKIGGFNNNFWPGEDSKLGNTLKEQEEKQILYHPSLIVYHHRRDTIAGHLKQYMQYGTMRGKFFAQGDANSLRIQYAFPSLFFMYGILYVLATLLYRVKPYDYYIFLLSSAPALIYSVLLFLVALQSLFRTKNIAIFVGMLFIIPATHITYGYFFIIGTVQEMLTYTSTLPEIKRKNQ